MESTAASGASVDIRHLTKSFGNVEVISGLSVSFRAGAISVLLGSSGCGKTTILRCIAGLEEPGGGDIVIQGRAVFSAANGVNVPPERRNLGMVFQSYAIWPHMTVYENVALPLRAHGLTSAAARERVGEVLTLVGLDGLSERSATKLSGGQQQRVAIARCLANEPNLILLDEPLSNLDANLRVNMRAELRDLQRRLGTTMIFVTHDQDEAMSLADEIFLFRTGRLVQSGPAADLYRRPKSRYVAEFFGKANLFEATIERAPDGDILRPLASAVGIARGKLFSPERSGSHLCMVRPEAWQLAPPSADGLQGAIESVMLLGDRLELQVTTPIGRQCVVTLGYEPVAIGDRVTLTAAADRVHFLLDDDDPDDPERRQP